MFRIFRRKSLDQATASIMRLSIGALFGNGPTRKAHIGAIVLASFNASVTLGCGGSDNSGTSGPKNGNEVGGGTSNGGSATTGSFSTHSGGVTASGGATTATGGNTSGSTTVPASNGGSFTTSGGAAIGGNTSVSSGGKSSAGGGSTVGGSTGTYVGTKTPGTAQTGGYHHRSDEDLPSR